MCIFCERFKSGGQGSADFAPATTSTLEQAAAEQCPTLRSRQRPATLVTGFLGCGKTTFLNYLLSTPHAPKGLAVLINEFGEVPVDDKLLQTGATPLAGDPVLVTMPNGCLCCKVRGDLVEALLTMAKNEEVRHVIVEGSGLAPTLPVAQTFLDPRVQPDFRLSHVVNVVDASRFAAQLADTGTYGALVREQLALASVILLNKVDLVSGEQRQRCVTDLSSLGAAVIPCRNARVNVAQVLREQPWAERLAESGSRPVTHVQGVWSQTVECAGAVDAAKAVEWLKGAVAGIGERLMRCKGLLAQGTGPAVVVQGVGQHVEVTEAARGADRSFLVFLGVGDPPAGLQDGFAACAAAGPQP
eukprot:EG_transcript_14248